MRLLKRTVSPGTHTRGYSLTEFAASRIPSRYAILSHRWVTDEVIYKDIENCTAHTKAGYRKLEFCAERAACDGISYFWIDTCCIDKTSSTELTEAINSMYKWYQNATKCYVYMSDVLALDGNGSSVAECEWQSAFQNSTWFTRGWTLQELIAPTVVEFFSAEKRLLGNKKSLEQQIHERTKIPVDALKGNLLQFDITERMSWATNRQTTHEEDAVYCMFGIVNVHMSPIYGEGWQHAMARLEQELQKFTDAAPGPGTGPSVMCNMTGGGNVAMMNTQQQTPARDVMEKEGK